MELVQLITITAKRGSYPFKKRLTVGSITTTDRSNRFCCSKWLPLPMANFFGSSSHSSECQHLHMLRQHLVHFDIRVGDGNFCGSKSLDSRIKNLQNVFGFTTLASNRTSSHVHSLASGGVSKKTEAAQCFIQGSSCTFRTIVQTLHPKASIEHRAVDT